MKEPVKKWVEALRSGNYRQGTGFLKNGDRFCCLGVMCDIHDPNKWIKGGIYFDGGEFTQLPPHNLAKIFTPKSIPLFRSTHFFVKVLARFNDDGKTFDEIADIIEAIEEGNFTYNKNSNTVKVDVGDQVHSAYPAI